MSPVLAVVSESIKSAVGKTELQKVKLKRNLRRDVLRGHPWVYREAIERPRNVDRSMLVSIDDHKGNFLAWGFYDPESPLALRILSTEKKRPDDVFFKDRIKKSIQRRSHLEAEKTTGFRLINGEGDRLPGLVCDVYGEVAVLQFDGDGPAQFWKSQKLNEWLPDSFKVIVEKKRGPGENRLVPMKGALDSPVVGFEESGWQFYSDLEKGQKTGFFFDQRNNRKYLSSKARDKTVLNLFSYTGGFSIATGAGSAKSVTSVDLSQGAIDFSEKNWQANAFSGEHKGVCADVFKFLDESKDKWDMVIVDPPSMAHSEQQKPQAVKKYTDAFARAAKKVVPGGDLVLSSCSSHISFDDFLEIMTEALSQARRTGVVTRVSGQGEDHPFPHVCSELRYLKFVHIVLD